MGGNRSDEKKPNLKSKKERKKGTTKCEVVAGIKRIPGRCGWWSG